MKRLLQLPSNKGVTNIPAQKGMLKHLFKQKLNWLSLRSLKLSFMFVIHTYMKLLYQTT